MKKFKFPFLLISFCLILFFTSCSNENSNLRVTQSKKEFSLLLHNLDTKSSADSLLNELKGSISDSIYIISQTGIDQDSIFQIRAGKYETALEAGYSGFSYVMDSLIIDYSVLKNNSVKKDIVRNFYFVAKYLNRPSLFKFNLINKKIELVWSSWGKKIISLNYTSELNPAFFVTALSYGKKTGFPFVRRANLYMFDRYKNQIKLIRSMGDGVQISTSWDSETLFKVILTKFDLKNSSKLYEITSLYDMNGKVISEKNYTFNLKEGDYPENLRRSYNTRSSDGMLKIEFARLKDSTIIDLREFKTGKITRLMSTQNQIDRIEWAPDDSFIFIRSVLTEQQNSPDTYELYSIDMISKKIKNVIKSFGVVNFKILGRLLVYEKGLGENSSLIFFDYKHGKQYYAISAAGGCGIYNIPFLVN